MNWQNASHGKVLFKEPLKRHTTLKIGGPADLWFEPRTVRDLQRVFKYARSNRIPVRVIGNGSNVLCNDKGVTGVVVRLRAPAFQELRHAPRYLDVGAGLALPRLVSWCARRGVQCCEFLAGIPGTVGGALAMNAGVTMTADDTNLTRRISSISDSVLQVTVLDSHGDIRRLSRRSIRFGYRSSSLTKYIILGARLACRTVGPKRVRSSVTKLLEYRRKAHNVRFPNAGCFFKNPSGASAGKLIDACGLKHRMVGGAMVSGAHANYLVNYDAATAADVLRLMKVVTDAVRKKFKISLQPEITIWKN